MKRASWPGSPTPSVYSAVTPAEAAFSRKSTALLRIFGLPLFVGSLVFLGVYWTTNNGGFVPLSSSSSSSSGWLAAGGDCSARDTAQRVVGWTKKPTVRPILEHDSRTWEAPTPELPLSATLEQRLVAWNSTPVATGSEWIKWNSRVCPNSRTYENKLWGFVSAQEGGNGPWESLWKDPAHVARIREEMFDHLRSVAQKGLLGPAHQGTGRGIVLSAGNADTFKRALVTVRLLREHLNSTIGVEIFHFAGETPDDDVKEALEKHGVKVREAADVAKDSHRDKNWHIKAAAIIGCSFREVLYLDSDNMPAFDPAATGEGVFFGRGYRELGVVFWPDYWKTVAQSPIWQLIGVQCREEWEQEAGAILVDKAKHLDALHLTDYMLKHYDFWFHISDGDKDLFRYAFLALRKRWAVPGRFVAAGSWEKGPADAFCGHTMLQHDHIGRPSFVHANMLKKIDVWQFKHNGPTGQLWGVSATTPTAHDDGMVHCDQLANPNLYGEAIAEAPPQLRARAALERGMRVWFYGVGGWPSCLNVRWDDPRTDDEVIISRYVNTLRPHEDQPKWFIGADDDWKSPLYRTPWVEDPRLRDFEQAFWDAGGVPYGKGF